MPKLSKKISVADSMAEIFFSPENISIGIWKNRFWRNFGCTFFYGYSDSSGLWPPSFREVVTPLIKVLKNGRNSCIWIKEPSFALKKESAFHFEKAFEHKTFRLWWSMNCIFSIRSEYGLKRLKKFFLDIWPWDSTPWFKVITYSLICCKIGTGVVVGNLFEPSLVTSVRPRLLLGGNPRWGVDKGYRV